jgi:hypothetical protein
MKIKPLYEEEIRVAVQEWVRRELERRAQAQGCRLSEVVRQLLIQALRGDDAEVDAA